MIRPETLFPVSAVLRQLSNELKSMDKMLSEVETAVGNIVAGKNHVSSSNMSALQKTDILRQSLSCISLFLEETAKEMPIDWVINPEPAATNLPLQGMARRLSQPDNCQPEPENKASNGVVFF